MKFLHVGDLHLSKDGSEEDTVICAEVRRRAADVDLVIIGGDMCNHGLTEEYDRFLDEMRGIEDKLVILRGNHDMHTFMGRLGHLLQPFEPVQFDPSPYGLYEWRCAWWEDTGNTAKQFPMHRDLPPPYHSVAQPVTLKLIDGTGPYYTFERGGFRFVVVDTCQWVLGEKQYAWLEEQLADTRPTILLIHHTLLPTGSRYDVARLFRAGHLIDMVLTKPHVLGVFSGHVHFNRQWHIRDTAIVVTAHRGGMREVVLADGAIQSIEPLDNKHRPGSGAYRDLPIEHDTADFSLPHLPADEVLYPHTFNIPQGMDGIWGQVAHAWVSSEQPAGLIWRIPELGESFGQDWFGLNFTSTSPWTIRVTRHGKTIGEISGTPGEALIVSERVEGTLAGCTVTLEQAAPAIGHASPLISLGTQRVTKLHVYPQCEPEGTV